MIDQVMGSGRKKSRAPPTRQQGSFR